jgi:hypothetical protein
VLTAALFGGFQFSLLLATLVVGWSGVNVVWWICEAVAIKPSSHWGFGVLRFAEWVDHRSDRCGNDPSAGSPTETLLRLILPLNDEV